MDFSPFTKAQNDKISRHYKMTKCVFFVRHCERAKRAWQSTNLNANLSLDCHEFARSRFANSRNDKVLVILSASEVSTNSKCDFSALRHILNSVDFSPFTKAQNDNGDFLLSNESSKCEFR